MRCTQCCKFVSYNDPPTVEVQETTVSGGSSEDEVEQKKPAPEGGDEAVEQDKPAAEAEVESEAEAPAETPEEKADDSAHGTVMVKARVVLCCQDCGSEMADTDIEAEADFDHTCDPEGQAAPDYDSTDEQFEVNDPDGEGNSRLEDKDRHGNPIKNPRYMRKFYGFDAECDVTCRKCGETFQVSVSGEEQASSFNECQ